MMANNFDFVLAIFVAMFEVQNDLVLKLLTKETIIRGSVQCSTIENV